MRLFPRALTKWIWKRVALFAYRRWADPDRKKPWGLPFNRDPDNPCSAYEPRKWQLGDWNDCQTDGHALCGGCAHRMPEVLDQGEEIRGPVFSRTKARSVDQIDEWFFEFVVCHMGRHPRSDWPKDDYERFRAFFSPWKAAFVRLGIDREAAEKASRMLTTEAAPANLTDHLPALARLAGRSDPDIISINLWSAAR